MDSFHINQILFTKLCVDSALSQKVWLTLSENFKETFIMNVTKLNDNEDIQVDDLGIQRYKGA